MSETDAKAKSTSGETQEEKKPLSKRQLISLHSCFVFFSFLVIFQAAAEPWNTIRPILFLLNLGTIAVVLCWWQMATRIGTPYAKYGGGVVLLGSYALAWMLFEMGRTGAP